MTIACLGWGSLIWDPGELEIEKTDPAEKAWAPDGPLLPVEFARHSLGHRLTLVLVPGRQTSPVLWSPLLIEDLEAAKRNLAIRECRRRDGRPPKEETVQNFIREWCGYWTADRSRGSCNELIDSWAREKDLQGVIWTDFPPRSSDTDSRVPTSGEVLHLLGNLTDRERENAMNYIRRAPRQIATEYRNQIETQFGWYPTGVV